MRTFRRAWRNNPHVNDYWICDEGRYGYKAANDPALLSAMYVKKGDDHSAVPSDEALKAVDRGLKQAVVEGKTIAGVLSPFLTVEEAYLMATYIKSLDPASVLALVIFGAASGGLMIARSGTSVVPPEPVARNVNAKFPTAVGVPSIAPVSGSRLRPGGSAPTAIA